MNRRLVRILIYLRRTAVPWGLTVAVVVGLLAGYMVRGLLISPAPGERAVSIQPAGEAQAAVQWWTCSMHPQIKLPKPGLCPICGMKLIPLQAGRGEPLGPRQVTISQYAKKLMEIQTVPVERKFVQAVVRMVGKVDYDETRLKYITAWVPGRLDRLYVDYTGVPVKKGDHMVSLYSPELLSAQQELIQALQTVRNLRPGDEAGFMRRTALATLEAAREKLRLWGLKPEQISQIEQSGKASDHVTIYAPIGGIVIHKNAQEGMYVDTGTRIYTIADLSKVWVRLDAYESDLMWLRYGQKVEFATEAYPGRRFTGTIAFIDPVLTQATRTVKVRLDADNPDMSLKPGMFVRAVVRAQVASGGRVMEASLAGKWICPMHPGVVKDAPGKCDICQMPLVRTESLGYLGVDTTTADKPLVIPASAALVTGTRAVVYVEVPGRDRPTYEGRQIVLGPRAGDYYLVRSGLAEGELVVTRGNFKLDAELQIQAKPSMMTPRGGGGGHQHGRQQPGRRGGEPRGQPPSAPTAAARQLGRVVESYLAMQAALAGDDKQAALAAAGRMLEAIGSVDMTLLEGRDHQAWMRMSGQFEKILAGIAAADEIGAVREGFALLSEQTAAMVERFGVPGVSLYLMKCPMAFAGRGATWLQADKQTRNPYFGTAVPACGEVVDTFGPARPAGGSR